MSAYTVLHKAVTPEADGVLDNIYLIAVNVTSISHGMMSLDKLANLSAAS